MKSPRFFCTLLQSLSAEQPRSGEMFIVTAKHLGAESARQFQPRATPWVNGPPRFPGTL